MTRIMRLSVMIAALCLPLGALAAPVPVVLEPVRHSPAELTVVDPDGGATLYTPASLEAFPAYRLRTTTPWRPEAASFEGVLLTDILAAHGLSDASAILVTAENDFTATIPRALWEAVDILVATRVDGRPHSRRARGPIQFVIHMDEYSQHPLTREEHLVWMAARIEAID